LQALNQSLILSAAWRLAKDPGGNLSLILKSKYFPDTSIWRATASCPKSAFWTSVLKIKPILEKACCMQIVDGSSSIWSTPWFDNWQNIYNNLVLQQPHFNYPAMIKDLWIPNSKNWNHDLVNSLFTPQVAASILNTPIIDDVGQDMLVWKLTPTGNFSTKSAYKHCFQNLQLPRNQMPKQVPQQVINLLNQVWAEKHMIPKVQTFAWRLLRRALATGKRAGRFSTHISVNCSRCNLEEDDVHLFFGCHFVKAIWFLQPWFINTEILQQQCQSIPEILNFLLHSNHPSMSVNNLYTMLWCIWKARNDALFNRAKIHPKNVFAICSALLQDFQILVASLQVQQQAEDHTSEQLQFGRLQHSIPFADKRVQIFSDAAWTPSSDGQLQQAGLGIHIKLCHHHASSIYVAALSPPVGSPLQAEAYGLLLAVKVAQALQLQDAFFLTDSQVLTSAARSNQYATEGPWLIRATVSQIRASSYFHPNRLSFVPREHNIKAHHHSRLALRINTSTIKCLTSGSGKCTVCTVISVSSVLPLRLMLVKCV
jgi:hypothetical protein